MVVDTHTHVWLPPSEDHPWINPRVMGDVAEYGAGALYGGGDLLADVEDAGVDSAVVVNFALTDVRDNNATIRAVEEHDDLHGIVTLDEFADDAPERLREYMSVDGILGLRLGALCPHDRMWMAFDPSVTWLADLKDHDPFWDAVRETDAVVQVLVHDSQLDQALSVVEAHPEVTYLFDHYAMTDPEVPPEEPPFATFAELADYDVGVKVSETPHRSNEGFPYEDVHDHVRWFVETFGRERVIWGSDYPNVSDVATYEESLGWLDHVAALSEADREWITEESFWDLVG
jgi:predicted TIM-barrel fold metal-dependent hydrolase